MEKRTVLFVDDDVIVLQSLERGLMDESYDKLFVKTCKEALEILQQEEVHVIVTDMCIPEMTGLELLRAVRKEHHNIIGIVLSGYEQDPDLQAAVDQGEIINYPAASGRGIRKASAGDLRVASGTPLLDSLRNCQSCPHSLIAAFYAASGGE